MLLFLSCLLGSAGAEDSPAIRDQKTRLSVLLLKLDSERKNNPRDERYKWRYTKALEELTAIECMPEAYRGREFPGSPEEEDCLKHLVKLENLDPHSPIAACVRFGTGAEECLLRWESQVVYPQHARPSADIDSKPPTNLPDPETSKYDLREITKQFREEPTRKMYEQLIEAYRPHLRRACYGSAIESVKKEELGVTVEDFSGNEDSDLSELRNLLSELQAKRKSRPTPSPFQNQPFASGAAAATPVPEYDIVRTRVIPSECYTLVQELLDAAPFSSLAVCLKESNLSPLCHRAREREKRIRWKKERVEGSTATPTPEDGIARF